MFLTQDLVSTMTKQSIISISWIWIIFMIFPIYSIAQGNLGKVEQISLRWNDPVTISVESGETITMLNHHLAQHEDKYNYLPIVRIKLTNVLVDSVAVIFHETEAFSADEKLLITQSAYKDVPFIHFESYYRYKDPITEIDIIPIDTVGGLFKPQSVTIEYYYNELPVNLINTNVYKQQGRNSVLSEGEWYKIGVAQNGIYKLTPDFLKTLGVNISSVDPRKIRIFGNGGKVLPQNTSKQVMTDLVENAIMVTGESDGRFDASDYILFYGQSPHTLNYIPNLNKINYENHPYSDTSYYYINIGTSFGKRIQVSEHVNGTFPAISHYDDWQVHEKNKYSIMNTEPHKEVYGGSGRNWYGERMNFNQKEVKVTLPAKGIISGSAIKLISSLAASSTSSSTFSIKLNGQMVGSQHLGAIIEGDYFDKVVLGIDTFNTILDQMPSDGNMVITLNYDNPKDSRTVAYLDYLIVQYQKELAFYSPQNSFTSLASLKNETSRFVIKNAGEVVWVWDITNGLEPLQQQVKYESTSAIFSTPTNYLKKFIAFDKTSSLLTPVLIEKVQTQNLHGVETPDLLIITHPDFQTQAERLAAFRRSHNGYSVVVATTKQVFNEFSSGSPDITAIRNFAKYLYDNGGRNSLKYLLLFGKSSFDFKNILGEGKNYVPGYQSRNSSHPIYSYSSDDYFGFLDDGEGEWEENNQGDHFMDIGVGRLPVTSLEEARIIVDKLVHYDTSPSTFDDWRKQIYFIADDEDNNSHLTDSEKLANKIESDYPRFNVNKIYLDAYPQISNPGERSPETNRSINEMIEKGALMVNYVGHGSPDQWADEQILTIVGINEWKNIDKLPLFVAATCQFGRQDNPTLKSGGEYLLFNPEGGAIGLVTTGRPVYASSNFQLNNAFYNSAFEKDEQQQLPTLGDIFRHTKNNSLQGNNNRSFSLLADPSMTLAYPKQEIKITGIKTLPGNVVSDTIKALQKIKIEGEIHDLHGLKDEYFQGELFATIFDKMSKVTTYGNKGYSTSFNQWDNLIYNGGAKVKDGSFSFEFIAPKNISYQMGTGKISLYAHDRERMIDAGGAEANIKIGGSILNAPLDDTPPDIKLFMEDTLFRNGGLTGNSPSLLIRLFDESGINISKKGLGQDITASIDGSPLIVMNHFYRSDQDDFRKGWISYPLNNLEEGPHEIVVKAWDTYNNSSESNIKFVVGSLKKLEIRKLTSNPNPFREQTELSFEHNRAGDDLAVRAQLISIRGELVRTMDLQFENSNSVVYLLDWDGTGPSGKKLETGLYILKVFVRSLQDGSQSILTTKITLIN